MRNVAVRLRRCHDIALTKIPLKHFECHSVDDPSRSGIVPSPFITHKCVRAVEFMPAENAVRVGQGIINDGSSLARYMRILAAKNDQKLPIYFGNSIQ